MSPGSSTDICSLDPVCSPAPAPSVQMAYEHRGVVPPHADPSRAPRRARKGAEPSELPRSESAPLGRALAGRGKGMTKIRAVVRQHDHQLTRRVAAWDTPWVRAVLPAAQNAAEHTVLWWGAAAVMAAAGGQRGRNAALTGLAAMALAEALSNGVGKQLIQRRRPPKEWIPHDEVEDRPDSSSFPSGHTAAGVAFAAATAALWPHAGIALAIPALAVSVGRIHSGAHYPTDVAAGTLIGLAATALTLTTRHQAASRWR